MEQYYQMYYLSTPFWEFLGNRMFLLNTSFSIVANAFYSLLGVSTYMAESRRCKYYNIATFYSLLGVSLEREECDGGIMYTKRLSTPFWEFLMHMHL